MLFVSAVLFAQNQRFIYEYQFKNDSTALEKPHEKEIMYLDISSKGSKYYSAAVYKADSILAERSKIDPDHNNFSGIDYGKIHSSVEKRYPDFSVEYFQHVDIDEYEVSDNRKMQWNIMPETQNFGEFKAQKATTEMYGRKWIAWFSSDIPLQEGPYKFHGLPGLIVKISDVQNTHIFELKGSQKLTESEEWISRADKASTNGFKPLIKMDQDKFKKLFQENRENPTKGMRQILASGNKIVMLDEKGNPMDIEKHLRDLERQQKDNNKRNNNLLELDLLK